MPDRPAWLDRLSDILGELHGWSGLVLRQDVERLLEIKNRQAQSLMMAAGASRQGKACAIEAPALALYLTAKAPPGWEQEEQRRKRRLANTLTQLRTAAIQTPPLHVEKPIAEARKVQRRAFDALPPSIELGPGWITVRFDSPEESLQRLLELSMAIAADRDWYDRLVSIPEFGKPSRSTAGTPPASETPENSLFDVPEPAPVADPLSGVASLPAAPPSRAPEVAESSTPIASRPALRRRCARWRRLSSPLRGMPGHRTHHRRVRNVPQAHRRERPDVRAVQPQGSGQRSFPMSYEPKYWTIQQFAAAKSKRGFAWTMSAALASIALFGLSALGYHQFLMSRAVPPHKASAPAQPSWAIPSELFNAFVYASSGSTAPPPLVPVTSGKSWRVLQAAAQKWSGQLGGVPVRQPPLYRAEDSLACGHPDSLACWDPLNQSITVIKEAEQRADLLDIMLHEVGHSIGVPHIKGDPLMDAQTQNLDFSDRLIPPMALAIARCIVTKECR